MVARPADFPRRSSSFSRAPTSAASLHLDERLVDRITSPFMSEELLGRVDALVRVRRVIQRDPALVASAAAPRSGGRPE